MSVEIKPNEKPLEISVQSKPSLFKIALWLIVILLLPQLVLGFGASIFVGIQQGSDFSEEAVNLWLASIPVLLTLTLIAPFLTLPLLNKATQAESWRGRFDFWAVKAINAKALAKWLMVGFIFWLISSFIGELLKLPDEPFMLDIKAAGNSVGMGVLMFAAICLVMPIMES